MHIRGKCCEKKKNIRGAPKNVYSSNERNDSWDKLKVCIECEYCWLQPGLGQGRTRVQLLITAVIWLGKENIWKQRHTFREKWVWREIKGILFVSPVIERTQGCVVLKSNLWNFVLWVYCHLECVCAWKEFGKSNQCHEGQSRTLPTSRSVMSIHWQSML